MSRTKQQKQAKRVYNRELYRRKVQTDPDFVRRTRERQYAYRRRKMKEGGEYARKRLEKSAQVAKAYYQTPHGLLKKRVAEKRRYARRMATDPVFASKKRLKDHLRRSAKGSHTLQEWLEVKSFYKNCCLCCGRQEPFTDLRYDFLTEDHVVPISRGGTNDISNIQPLCIDCNLRKHAKTVDYRNKG